MMEIEKKCTWAPTCPYYETISSYGRETIRCSNTDCLIHGIDEQEEEEKENTK